MIELIETMINTYGTVTLTSEAVDGVVAAAYVVSPVVCVFKSQASYSAFFEA